MNKHVNGFTLLELMLAVVVSSIVAFAIGSVLVAAHRNLLRSMSYTDLQREVSLAMSVIEDRVRDTPSLDSTISFSSDTLYFDVAKTEYVKWDRTAGTLVLQPEGIELISNRWDIQAFTAVRRPNRAWDIVLQVTDPEYLYTMTMPGTYLPRQNVYE